MTKYTCAVCGKQFNILSFNSSDKEVDAFTSKGCPTLYAHKGNCSAILGSKFVGKYLPLFITNVNVKRSVLAKMWKAGGVSCEPYTLPGNSCVIEF